MRRTQLYLEDEVSDVLRIRSRQSGLTISELVRRAVREQYLAPEARRKEAMQAQGERLLTTVILRPPRNYIKNPFSDLAVEENDTM